MKARIPLIPTVIVIVAVLAMIGLGVWQLQRRAEKEAALSVVAANPAKRVIAFPAFAPIDPSDLFRRSSVQCLRVVGWRSEAGKAADGTTGYRYIAECATGAEGP
ncbi:MAG: SURF1 family cytochrome oxidase biogenesis protein, partial [Sphingobium sp.]